MIKKMKTIEKCIRIIKNYSALAPLATKDEQEQMKSEQEAINAELLKFYEENKAKSMLDQHKIFFEKVGPLITNIQLDYITKQMIYLKSINSTLNFFKILVIISIVIGFVLAILQL